MAKVILTVGIPGCGKSTFAETLRETDPENVVILERDEIRTQLFGENYHSRKPDRKSEELVNQVEKKILDKAVAENKTLIISNTNTNPRIVGNLVRTLMDKGVNPEFKYFDVPVEECLRRNNVRGDSGGRRVPENVIRSMAAKIYDDDGKMKEYVIGSKGETFLVSKNTPGSKLLDNFNKNAEFRHPMVDEAIVVVDVDGTLAMNNDDARKYLSGKNKDYNRFFREIKNAAPNREVVKLANKMRKDDNVSIVVVTGRSDKYASELLSFIKGTGLNVSRIYAKREGDNRKDYDYKRDILSSLNDEGLNVVHAIDDRPVSIEVFESNGIIVSKVDETGAVDSIYGSGKCIRCGQPLKKGNIGPKCRLK